MSKYIDLVLCKHDNSSKQSLFFAPGYSYLKVGDRVIVDTAKGENYATVLKSVTVNKESDVYPFILKATGATTDTLKRVLKKVTLEELDYSEVSHGNTHYC